MKYALILLSLTLCSCAVQTSLPNPELQIDSPTSFEQLEPQATGITYYVSGTGKDTNNGLTTGAAFRTLQRAADLTQPGDTVLVMNGTYTKPGPQTNVLQISRSGEPGNYIRYKAVPGQTPRIKLDDNYAGIQINAAYIVVEGFTVEGDIPNLSADEAMRRALLPPEKKSEALDNSLFNGSGIFAYPKEGRNPHHLIIRNNYVFNCPATGIAANGADYIRIENNRVHNNSYYSAYATSGVSFYQTRGIDDSSAAKMFVRNNVIYGNENKVPFWFSNENSPSQRVITDGNGVIVDDGRNTQSIVGDVSVAYKGKTVIENNLVYGNGGRGVNVYSSDNVQIRYNTTYQNAKAVSSAITSELSIGDASNVQLVSNIVVARSERKLLGSYNTNGVTSSNNLFSGGSGAPEYPGGSKPNLVQNGDFSVNLANWGLSKAADAGYVQNTRDEFGRNCVYVDQGGLANTYDVYLFQKGLTLKKGSSYTLSLDAITSKDKAASFVVKFGGSSSPYTPYAAQSFNLSGDQRQAKTFSFKMDNSTNASAQLELQVGKNLPASYFCFDNLVLTEMSDVLADPQFVNPTTDPATASFRLKRSSPAVDAGTTTAPRTDLKNTSRPQGAAPDLGAYESF